MKDKPLPNKLKPMLSPTEEKFYITLQFILKDKYIINSKTRFSDTVNKEKYLPDDEFETFTKQHVDFTICDKEIPSDIKLLIEYDDSSHNKEDAKIRDDIKNKVTKGIPFVRINVEDNLKTIKNKIEKELNLSNQTTERATTKKEVYIDDSQIENNEQNNNISIWSKSKKSVKEFLIENVVPAIIGVVGFIIIATVVLKGFQNWANGIQQKMITPKKPIIITPSPIPMSPPPYENKILIPAQPPPSVKENTVIASPKIRVKVRIAGKYISENKSFVMYERIDTKKQKTVTIEDFMKMCECSDAELYTDRLIEIVEYP